MKPTDKGQFIEIIELRVREFVQFVAQNDFTINPTRDLSRFNPKIRPIFLN